ncbi:MAG: hypothetical protein ACO3JL_00850 [Myxococcota bacterium]
MTTQPHGYRAVARAFFWFGLLAGFAVVSGAWVLIVKQREDMNLRFPSPVLLGEVLRSPSHESLIYAGLAGLLCLPLVRNLGLSWSLARRGEIASAALALSSCALLVGLYLWLS